MFKLKKVVKVLAVAAAVVAGGFFALSKNNVKVQATDPGMCSNGTHASSAIIDCGVKNVDEIILRYSEKSHQGEIIRDTYAKFGITEQMLWSLKANYDKGSPLVRVYQANNQVKLNDKVIGFNAVTAGRRPNLIDPSRDSIIARLSDTSIYSRPYNLSNTGDKQAFALFDGEKMVFAILAECGNPVTVDTPQLKIEKTISKDNQNFAKTANFKAGEKAYFKLVVTETTKKADAQNVVVTDVLPKGFTYLKGSGEVEWIKWTDDLSNITIDKVEAGKSVVIKFQAMVNLVDKACGSDTITNNAVVDSDLSYSDTSSASANVAKECIVAKCTSINPSATSVILGGSINFTATSEVKNTTVSTYSYTVDGKTAYNGLDTFKFTPTEAKTYKVKVVAFFKDGSENTNANCETVITVTPKPITDLCLGIEIGKKLLAIGESTTIKVVKNPENVFMYNYKFVINDKIVQNEVNDTYVFTQDKSGDYNVSVIVVTPKQEFTSAKCADKIKVYPSVTKCVALSLDKTALIGSKVNSVLTYSLTAGASFKNAKVEWGDTKSDTEVKTTNNTVAFSHTYDKVGSYKLVGTVTFEKEGVAVTETCTAEIVISDVEKCKYDNTILPEDKNCPRCEVEGKKDIASTNPECKEKVLAKVAELPKTGPKNYLAIFAATTVVVYGALILKKKYQK